MKDVTFIMLSGTGLVLVSFVSIYLFLRFKRKDKYDSPILDLSNFKVLLSLLAIGLLGFLLLLSLI